jgi:hypothetical protein
MMEDHRIIPDTQAQAQAHLVIVIKQAGPKSSSGGAGSPSGAISTACWCFFVSLILLQMLLPQPYGTMIIVKPADLTDGK